MIWPTGAKLDIPAADFWYMRDGKIQEFNSHIGTSAMFAQLGALTVALAPSPSDSRYNR